MPSQNEPFNLLREELRSGLGELTNEARLTNKWLDRANNQLSAFKNETAAKLDGIVRYLRSVDGNVQDHSDRIFKLEERVNQIEKQLGA